MVREGGFDGRFLVDGDDRLGPADCRIRWQGGGLERRETEIWQEIDGALERFLGDAGARGQADNEDPDGPPAESADAADEAGTKDATAPGDETAGVPDTTEQALAPAAQSDPANRPGDAGHHADVPPCTPDPLEDR